MNSCVFEFPMETSDLIDKIALYMKIDRAEVFSKALGLLQIWMEVNQKKGKLIQRTRSGKEYEI